MDNRKYLLTAFICLTCIASTASAAPFRMGTKDGGGGVGYSCRENGGAQVYLADTYAMVTAGELKGLESLSEEQIFLAAARTLKEPLVAGWSYKFRSDNLLYVDQGRLDLLGDDNIADSAIPTGCTKVQLAIQDLRNHVVNYDKSLVEKMSKSEQGLLRLHETFISIRNNPGEDTTAIRTAVEKAIGTKGAFAKFISQLADPDSIHPSTVIYDARQLSLVQSLPGNYIGRDSLNKTCALQITLSGTALSFSLSDSNGHSQSISKIEVEKLAQKLADDTEFRIREDRNYSANWDFVNFYRYQGVPSLFGIYPTTEMVALGWNLNTFESISIEAISSTGGPFRDPNQDESLSCFGLQK